MRRKSLSQVILRPRQRVAVGLQIDCLALPEAVELDGAAQQPFLVARDDPLDLVVRQLSRTTAVPQSGVYSTIAA
jgi:hypothetical protein